MEDADVQTLPAGGFFCVLCDVKIPNQSSLDAHLGGKKHRRLVGLRALRKAQEERSVFVSGFAKGTSQLEITDYCMAFGSVSSIIMDKDKGVYAIVEFESADAVEVILSQNDHVMNGQCLRVKPREKKGFHVVVRKKGAGGKGQLMGLEQLSTLLCQQETVEEQMLQLVRVFQLSESAVRLRNLLVNLLQEVFTEFFPGCIIHPFGSTVNGFGLRGSDMDLFLDLENAKTFQAKSKKLTEKEEEAKKTTEPMEEDKGHTSWGDESSDESVHSEESMHSEVDLEGALPAEVLEMVALVLRKCVPGVHKVQAVPTARLPVVKFIHRESGLQCDITINNRLPVQNTKLLQLYAAADSRVKPLVYTVRYWAKQKQLAGNTSGGGPHLNNYALTLLVVYFLQTRQPPILPTVSRLKELAGEVETHVVDGWDCSFLSEWTDECDTDNTDTLNSLLPEFFKFYASFDFSGSVISLREGVVFPVAEFFGISKTEQANAKPKLRLGPINVQDPFELNHNVAGNVSERMARRFKKECDVASKYCRSLQYQHKSTKGKVWGLVKLFQLTGGEDISPMGSPDPTSSNAAATKTTIEIAFKVPSMSETLKNKMKEAANFRGVWFNKVCQLTQRILMEVLKFDVRRTDVLASEPKESEATKVGHLEKMPQEIDVQQTSSACSKRTHPDDDGGHCSSSKKAKIESCVTGSVRWSCSISAVIWVGRRKVKRQVKLEMQKSAKEPACLKEPCVESTLPTIVQEEARITEAILKQSSGTGAGDENKGPLLSFTLSAALAGGTQDTKALLTVTPIKDEKNSFQDLFHFLDYFLPKQVEKCLEHDS
ncbi:speckle targeted PIP5K1A-regulated poly(A) polymerase-like [Lethenteron reissneri]|uniref:speckle targeted PIP5K1A-regulated poly(A) polymerase-like n=1 Tax=Lethenteron reissneri TaxID=7753 RepID=UPI002AB7E1F0|nr:speckle targeted PIP5K1A-regulated poly(A) polymerase-like [Lethenteron reissneri]